MSERSWYAAGLRFSCRRCGSCCTGEPGHVWLAPGEAATLAGRLALTEEEFLARHARWVHGMLCLREEEDGCCVLFEPGRGCRAYEARPHQCRTWPFWPRIVASPEAWEREAAGCPGMGTGLLHGPERIAALAREPVRPERGGRR